MKRAARNIVRAIGRAFLYMVLANIQAAIAQAEQEQRAKEHLERNYRKVIRPTWWGGHRVEYHQR